MELINEISLVDIALFGGLVSAMIAAYYSVSSKLQRSDESAERTSKILDNIEKRTRKLEEWKIRHQAFAEVHGEETEEST